jgi:hypothetical protein
MILHHFPETSVAVGIDATEILRIASDTSKAMLQKGHILNAAKGRRCITLFAGSFGQRRPRGSCIPDMRHRQSRSAQCLKSRC